MVISALCSCLGQNMEHHANTIGPYIVHGLKSRQPSLVRLSCGLVSDLSTALQEKVGKHLNELVPQLISLLEEKNGDRQAKTAAITALGDLCMHGGDDFVKYLEQVKGPLARAICAASKPSAGLAEE